MKKSFILFGVFFILTMALIQPQALYAVIQQYTVSGTVVDGGGRGIDGVQINYGEGLYVWTSDGGLYSFTVDYGWQGTVTPDHYCYSFTPPSASIGPVYANTVQNFLATLYMYTISGTTMDDTTPFPNPIAGVLLTLSVDGVPINTDVSGGDGSYSFTVPCGTMCTVTPMKVGWGFNPPNRFYEGVNEDYTNEDYIGTASTTTYTISGRVSDGTGRIGMDGATITFFDGTTMHEEITSGGGYYSYTVPIYWTGTVTPSLDGYSFSPTFANVGPVTSNVTQDFVATASTYLISGIVTDDDSNPIQGVTMTLSSGSTQMTDINGLYSFTVRHGWSGYVRPSRPGWTFLPTQRNYSNVTSDQTNGFFVGYRGGNRVTISGAVRHSKGTGIPGVTLTFTPGGTVKTDDNGDYSNAVTFGWSGTVTPSLTGYTFTPANRTYSSVKSNLIDQDYIYYSGSSPEIYLNPTELNFGTDTSGTANVPQSFLISNNGAGTLNWTVSPDQGWMSCSPLSGSGTGTVTVSVDPSGLAVGTYTGTITVSDPNAVNSPQTVSVLLNIYDSTNPPFGSFSTPVDGSTVSGSIAVTGWALDDVGVESVKIYRQDNGSLVYIGNAVFVEGARPDVELLYPDYPNNSRAGWGYMMLTNFLPNGGNGTYTLFAKATDVEGNEATLGTKTITCDNANAVKPFGAIDTPTQGGEASGSSFLNHGWALTPQPNSIPTDGSTINVFVDGVDIGNPAYNMYRPDVAALFPGYANSSGAGGYFNLDTTTYTNGVHTIYWTAEDDAGNTDGIGSRFFTIQNPGSSSSSSRLPSIRIDIKDLNKIPGGFSIPVRIQKGYSKDVEPQPLYLDNKGASIIHIKELERVEIKLSGVIAGYMVVGSEFRSLPIGSTLDVSNGTFYWLAGPGFNGIYQLMFVVKQADGELYRKNIMVKIGQGV
jgi:hypothetical protein